MRSFLYSIILAGVIIYFQSCDVIGPGRPTYTNELFRIKVDSFSLPVNPVFSIDTLKITFWGTIGNDGCYSFAHFQRATTSNQLDLVLWGRNQRTSEQTCTQQIVKLDGKQFFNYPVSGGDYIVVIHQPDGSLMQKTIYIHP
jgi:hypothetical protein